MGHDARARPQVYGASHSGTRIVPLQYLPRFAIFRIFCARQVTQSQIGARERFVTFIAVVRHY